jgi:hypothetical protein
MNSARCFRVLLLFHAEVWRKVLFMNTINICFGVFVLLISMVAVFRLYRIRIAQRHIAGYGSQTMCPFCGSITARSEAHCLHCGKSLRDA